MDFLHAALFSRMLFFEVAHACGLLQRTMANAAHGQSYTPGCDASPPSVPAAAG